MQIKFLNATDKPVLADALKKAGVKARIKVLRQGLRVCFVGPQEAVLSTINALGCVNIAGKPFTYHSFNQPHEIFIHGKIA